MVWDESRYRVAVLDAKFKNAIVTRHPDMITRFTQAMFFKNTKGMSCGYCQQACRLTVHELTTMGYQFDNGKIRTPDGVQLWPTTL